MYNLNREAKALLSRLKAVALICAHYEKAKEKKRFEKKESQIKRII